MPHSLIIIGILAFMAWVYITLQKKIGEIQQLEWKEYVRSHPEYFKTSENSPKVTGNLSNEQKKSSLKEYGRDIT